MEITSIGFRVARLNQEAGALAADRSIQVNVPQSRDRGSSQRTGQDGSSSELERVLKFAMTRQRAIGIAHVDGPMAVDLDTFPRSSRWLVCDYLRVSLAGG